MSKEKFKMVVTVSLVLIKDDKILLQRRYNTGYEDGNYNLPSGHLEGNESVKNAMIREAKEEIGIDIKQEDLEVILSMHRKSKREEIDYFLKADKWSGEIKNMEPEECDDLSWYQLKDLPKNTIDFIRVAMESYTNNITFIEYGWRK